MKRILVVDDDPMVLDVLRAGLEGVGFDVTVASDFSTASELIRVEEFELLITDLDLPGGTGLELATWARAHRPEMRSILITGYGCCGIRRRAEELGLSGYFEKPLRLASLAKCVCASLGEVSSASTVAQTDLVPQISSTDNALGQ
jgi:two-component system response regulator DesR